jgi:lipopolysaccharide transport system permease protein
VLSSLVDLGISFLILIGMLVFFGIRPNWGILLVPVFLAVAGMTGLGVGLWFGGIIVRYRDFGQVAGYMVRLWMYVTPVVYSITIVPEQLLTLYRLNPMTGVVEGFRWALLGTGRPPDWTLLVSVLIMVPIFIGGLYTYKRAERNIVDIA